MRNSLLYIITVLIWGSTWIAIEFQIAEAAVELSLFLRMCFAAILMFMISFIRRKSLYFTIQQHGWILFLGCSNFSLNYYIIYNAQHFLSSALTSVAFSLMLVMNIINSRLIFKTAIPVKIYIGSAFGILGISLLFLPEL
ncbi:MAG: DMT family transporter, partial [Pseudomonadota bacterium]